jgi:hypothetical protein
VKFVWAIYGVGAVLALWRTDAGWPTRIALALLWPVGPVAFLITVAILLGASLIAFPVVAGLIAAVVAAAAWWLIR